MLFRPREFNTGSDDDRVRCTSVETEVLEVVLCSSTKWPVAHCFITFFKSIFNEVFRYSREK